MLQHKLAQTRRKVAAAANLLFQFFLPSSLLPPDFCSMLFSQSMAYLQVGKTGFKRVLKLLTQTEFNKFKSLNNESKTIKDSKDSLKKLLVS